MTSPDIKLKSHARAVVIGGGLVGCPILYHLTKLGWTDVFLLERSELTSGSTWHAAANIHRLHDSTSISQLQHYRMGLYKEPEAETGLRFLPTRIAVSGEDRSAGTPVAPVGRESAPLRDELPQSQPRRGGAATPPWSTSTASAASCTNPRAATLIPWT